MLSRAASVLKRQSECPAQRRGAMYFICLVLFLLVDTLLLPLPSILPPEMPTSPFSKADQTLLKMLQIPESSLVKSVRRRPKGSVRHSRFLRRCKLSLRLSRGLAERVDFIQLAQQTVSCHVSSRSSGNTQTRAPLPVTRIPSTNYSSNQKLLERQKPDFVVLLHILSVRFLSVKSASLHERCFIRLGGDIPSTGRKYG